MQLTLEPSRQNDKIPHFSRLDGQILRPTELSPGALGGGVKLSPKMTTLGVRDDFERKEG